MTTSRLTAFSDGVLAIIITIMVLQLPRPDGTDWSALRPLLPSLASYVLSFVFVGIYWNNHHHLLAVARRADGRVLWANLALLFWLSLLPLVTSWVGATGFAPVPWACYAAVALLSGAMFTLLSRALRRADPENAVLARATGRNRKELISVALYGLALLATLLGRPGAIVAAVLIALVAVIWLLPDRRVERAIAESGGVDAGA